MNEKVVAKLSAVRLLERATTQFLLSHGRKEDRLSRKDLQVMLEIYLGTVPYTIRGASEALGIRQPDVTRCAKKLVTLGLLAKKPVLADGRAVYLTRTEQGQEFLIAFAEALPG